eukprot:gene14971-16670_t
MLSTITCTKGNKYSFYCQTEIWDEIDLTITNGQIVWMNNDEINERKITYECRPNSRKKESKISYLSSLKSALIIDPAIVALDLPSRVKYSYEITTADDILTLTVKEQLPDTTLLTILYKGTFSPKPHDSAVHPVMELLNTFSTIMHNKTKNIADLEKKNQDLNLLIEKNLATIQELNDLKESLQTTMIQKMCVVLNTKKREIQLLREQVDQMNIGGSKGRLALPDDDVIEVEEVVKPKATRGRKPAATTKKEAAKPAVTKKATTRKATTSSDKIKANIKTTTKRNTRKKTYSSDEEDEDEYEDDGFVVPDDVDDDDDNDDDGAMDVDNLDDTDDEETKSRPKKKSKVQSSSSNAPTTTTIDFERIKQLAEGYDKKKAKPNHDDSDATVDEDVTLLKNPRAKEVQSSQIMDFLSSQSQGDVKTGNSSSNAGGLFSAAAGNDEGDETNDEKSVAREAPSPFVAKADLGTTRRVFQGIADNNKNKKSRRLLDDSDDD